MVVPEYLPDYYTFTSGHSIWYFRYTNIYLFVFGLILIIFISIINLLWVVLLENILSFTEIFICIDTIIIFIFFFYIIVILVINTVIIFIFKISILSLLLLSPLNSKPDMGFHIFMCIMQYLFMYNIGISRQ